MKIHYSLFILSMIFFHQSLSAAEYDTQIGWADVRQLGLPVPGLVKNISVAAGSYVKPGEKMLSLDCGLYRAQLKQSQALVKGLQPAVETALKEKELADELFERTVLSEVEHRQAQLLYIEKKSKRDSAMAHTEQMQWQASHCDLVADSQLIVLDVHVNKGQLFSLLTGTQVLITVADQKNMLASSKLSLPLKEKYKTGQAVKVKLDGKLYDSRLKSITYASDNTVVITADIDIFDPRLITSKAAKLIIK